MPAFKDQKIFDELKPLNTIEGVVGVLQAHGIQYQTAKGTLDTLTLDPKLVAEIDNRVVGFVLGRAGELEFGLPGTVAWIEMIGVDPAHRRRGVAQALVEKFGESAEDHGIRTIFTLVTSNQTEMQHFFSRLGFVHGKMIHYQKELGG